MCQNLIKQCSLLLFVGVICHLAVGQDFEPQTLPPYRPRTTTTTTATETEATSAAELFTTTEPATVGTSTQAAATTIKIKEEEETTDAPLVAISSTMPSITTEQTSTITWRPEITARPSITSEPPFNPTSSPQEKLCYYKQLRGQGQLVWTHAGFHVIYPQECYHCCLFTNSLIAGCNLVSNTYCCENNYLPYYNY